MEPQTPLALPFISPWRQRLVAMLSGVERALLLVSPFLKDTVIADVEGALTARVSAQPLSIRVLTRVRLDDLLAGASDLSALERIVGWSAAHPAWEVELRALDNTHAKVWVSDTRMALVGSGNATIPGLAGNVEYGVELRDPATIQQILTDWRGPWEQAERVTRAALTPMRQALEAMAADETVSQTREALERRKAELAREAGAQSRLGVAFPLAPSPVQAMSESHPSERATTPPEDRPVPRSVELTGALSAPEPPLELRLDHLWQAIEWVIPTMETSTTSAGYYFDLTAASAFKITCEPVDGGPSLDNGKTAWPSLVRLTWADGVREVTATLPALVKHDHAEYAFIRGYWAATLNTAAISRLIETLSSYTRMADSARPLTAVVRLYAEQPTVRLACEGWRVASRDDGGKNEELIGARTRIDVAPAPWDPGPIEAPQPVVNTWTSQSELSAALRFLRQPLPTSASDARHQRTERQVVEIRVDAGSSALALTRGGLMGRIEHLVALHDLHSTGRAPAFRVDQNALNQLVRFKEPAGDQQLWDIRIPQHAEFIQFEPRGALDTGGFPHRTRWYWHLRNVE